MKDMTDIRLFSWMGKKSSLKCSRNEIQTITASTRFVEANFRAEGRSERPLSERFRSHLLASFNKALREHFRDAMGKIRF